MENYAHLFGPLAERSRLVYFCYRPADDRVLYVSGAYEREWGGNAARVNEEMPGWLRRLHPDDRHYLRDRLALAAAGELVENAELRLARPGGGTQWLQFTAVGTPGPAGGVLLSGYLEDVTAARNNVENAHRYQAKKNAMLEILSHDLASPLVLVQQASEYLSEKVEPLRDERLVAVLADMQAACRDGMNLIRDFVEQEFLESANVDLHLERLDLVPILHDLVETYRQRQSAAGHHFSFEAADPSVYALIDDTKFLQVINNLVGNALKFTLDGGHIDIELSQSANHVLVRVSDNGIGIPAELLPGLFERFTHARRPGLRGERTTGLGMSIIKTIVQLHGGRVWGESEEGSGTAFYIELPRPAEG